MIIVENGWAYCQPDLKYQVIDSKTGNVITACATRKAAVAKAIEFDILLGEARYIVNYEHEELVARGQVQPIAEEI